MDKDELLSLGIEEAVAEKIILEQEAILTECEERIAALKLDNEIEMLLKESGAKNTKAVRALLQEGDAESVKSQLEQMKKSEDTRFLFETKKSFAPARSGERLPDAQKGGYEARLAEARKAGNTIEAIRIKQKAASEGIVLI